MTIAPTPLDTQHLPLPAGRWDIDTDHTNVEFRVRHGVTRMRGRFDAFSGHVEVGPDGASVEVTVDASSVNTGQDDRDGHLRSDDFFDVENHPEWTFASTAVDEVGDDGFVLSGDLTIRGVTRPVRFDVDYHGVLEKDPWEMTRAGFSARATINRDDFDVSWNDLIDGKFPFVGKSVRLELEVELIHRP